MPAYLHLFAGGSYTDGSGVTGNTASIAVSVWIGTATGTGVNVHGLNVLYTTGLLLTAARLKIKDMYNAVRDWTGRVTGFRCSVCGGIYHAMWGNVCNQCREDDRKHNEMVDEMRKLRQEIDRLKSK